MKKRHYFLLFSVLINISLVVILVYKLQEPVTSQLPHGQVKLVKLEGSDAVTPAVIGESEDIQKNLVKVTKIIDGDTVGLETGEVIRYIGIDTPEISRGVECFAIESTDKNKELVLGKYVRLEKDISEKDKYGRLLRFVFSGDIFINEYLVKEGYASASTYPPDVKYSEVFSQAESEARMNKRGLWGKCDKSLSPTTNLKNESENVPINTGQNLDLKCSSNTYNCSDFKTQAEAQSTFETCGGSNNDIHKLDRDNDGRVCETLP